MSRPAPQFQPEQPRLLVIDDTQAIHDDFRKILAGDEAPSNKLRDARAAILGITKKEIEGDRYQIDSAFQGEEGLAKVVAAKREGRPYSIAFVDMRMPPGWDGLETILRIWGEDPLVQIVICTAYSDQSWQELCSRIGPTDRLLILKKPFDAIEIRQMARTLVLKWALHNEQVGRMEELDRLASMRAAELARKDQLFESLLRNAPLAMVMVDELGEVTGWSPSARTLFGWTAEEVIGSAVPFIADDDRGSLVEALRDHQSGQSMSGREWRLFDRHGKALVTAAWSSALNDPQQGFSGILLMFSDITERRRLESEQVALEGQLQEARRLEAIGQLAAGVAHEINTPLQYVSDNTEFCSEAFKKIAELEGFVREAFAASNGDGSRLREVFDRKLDELDIEYILAEAPKSFTASLDGLRRVGEIVRAMKAFAHPGGHSKVQIDLNQLLRDVVVISHNEWKFVAEAILELEPSLPPVWCRAGEMNQVFLNLIINASHAIADHRAGNDLGRIVVRSRSDDKHVVVEISDTGGGIPPEIRHRIFEPFFTTKEVGRGTGQGLSIIQGIIAKGHGGTVSFDSEMGKGTTFRVLFPIGDGQA